MKIEVSSLRQSATLKVAVIGFLIIILLIPIAMISGVINDRHVVAEDARVDISRSWGGQQRITGPVIHMFYTEENKSTDGTIVRSERSVFLLAEQLSIEMDIETQLRRRGIYEVPVYNARVHMAGQFDLRRIREFVNARNEIQWAEASLVFGISDASTVTSKPTFKSADYEDVFDSSVISLERFPPQLAVKLGELLASRNHDNPFIFDIEFVVSGSDLLEILPLADDSEVFATSNWHSPGFVGRRLPGDHEITDNGFSATWHATSLGRSLPTDLGREALPA